MKRAYLLVLATTSSLLWSACAGRATLGPLDDEPYTSSNGSGGTGGSGGTTSNGGAGGTTDTVVSTSITATSVTNTTVTVTGPDICDMSGDCGFCAECAIQGPCGPAFQACNANPDCLAFGDCLDNCMGQGCFPQCAQQHPNGVQDYIAAVQCVVCDVCEEDCSDQAPPQLCEF